MACLSADGVCVYVSVCLLMVCGCIYIYIYSVCVCVCLSVCLSVLLLLLLFWGEGLSRHFVRFSAFNSRVSGQQPVPRNSVQLLD